MRKTQIHWLIIGFVLLCVFNFLFFWLDLDRDYISIWVSYAFIHLAYIQLIAVPFLVPKSKSTHIFLEGIAAISAAYFLTEIVLGSVFILLALEAWKLVFLIQLIILLVNAFILYINIVVNKRTANTEQYKKQVQKTIKTAMNYLQQAKQITVDDDRALIISTYDSLKASPLLVDENIRGIEKNILTGCKSILDTAQGNQFDEMRKQIALVNQMIQLRKNCST
jgi:hypothetical protein